MNKRSDLIGVKEALAATINWRCSLPQFIFIDSNPKFAYLFEGPFTSRPFLLPNFAARLGTVYRTPSFFSISHDSGVGSFDRTDAAATTVVVQPAEAYEERQQYANYVNRNPYTGVSLGSDLHGNWYMFCDFSSEVGVLISSTELLLGSIENEPLMTPGEFLAEYGRSESGWDLEFVSKLANSYS